MKTVLRYLKRNKVDAQPLNRLKVMIKKSSEPSIRNRFSFINFFHFFRLIFRIYLFLNSLKYDFSNHFFNQFHNLKILHFKKLLIILDVSK